MYRNPFRSAPPRPALLLALMLPILPAIAGCASPAGDYPSLAIREAERATGTMAVPASPPPPPSPPAPGPAPAMAAELAALADAAAQAHRAFLAAAPAATRTIEAARSAGTGSEPWARAQVALAGLTSARSRTMMPLADLDRLYVAAAVEGGALAPISAIRDPVEAQVAEQSRIIERLSAVLAR
ncbi:MAG: hypothetical protein H5U21_05060 [Porphyrobacter sp.]|nr:hypothetical protein [Porphyrobacter sp.]